MSYCDEIQDVVLLVVMALELDLVQNSVPSEP